MDSQPDSPARAPLVRRLTRRRLLVTAGGFVAAAAAGAVGGRLLADRLRPRTIRLGILQGTQTLWRYFALQKARLLEPLGHHVEFANFPAEGALQDAFIRGELDGMANLPTVLPLLAARGVPVQLFLPFAWLREGFPLVVRRESAARSVADLAGRPVASLPLDQPGMAYWRALALANYGLHIENHLALRQAASPEQLLLQGQVEGAVIASPAWAALKTAPEFRLVSDLSSEWRRFSGSGRLPIFGGYIARRDWIAEQRGFVEDLLRLHAEALERYTTDRTGFLAAVSRTNGLPELEPEANQAIATYLGYDDVKPERLSVSDDDVADYEQLFPLLLQSGFLVEPPPAALSLFYVSPLRRPRSSYRDRVPPLANGGLGGSGFFKT